MSEDCVLVQKYASNIKPLSVVVRCVVVIGSVVVSDYIYFFHKGP